MFNRGYRRRLVAENPCNFVEKMPEPKFQREIPTQEEMSRIIPAMVWQMTRRNGTDSHKAGAKAHEPLSQ